MSIKTQSGPRDPIAIPGEPYIYGRLEDRASPRVLIINADAVTLEALQLTLEFEGFGVHQAATSAPALALLEHEDFAVVLADHELLEQQEQDLLKRTAIRQPFASIVALTSVFSVNRAMEQVSAGHLFGFVTKPWLREELIATISAGAATATTRKENAGLRQELRDLNHSTTQLQMRIDSLGVELGAKLLALKSAGQLRQRSLESALQFCHHFLAYRNPLLAARSQQLVAIARKFSQLESFTPEAARQLVLGAALCDIGMVGFDHALLEQVNTGFASLTETETETYETHPLLSYNLASHFDPDPLVATLARNHHECFDGSGFPEGLKGDAIPWLARCLAVAVQWVEQASPHPAALEAVIAQSGRTLDPAAVNLFCRIPSLVDDPELFRTPLARELLNNLNLTAPLYGPESAALKFDRKLSTGDLLKKLAPIDRSTQLGQRLQVLG